MSNFGGPNSQFEKDFRNRFNNLNIRLNKIENNIQNIIFDSMRNPKKTSKYWEAVRIEIDDEYKKLNGLFNGWAEKEIPLRYRKSIRQIGEKINSTKSIINSASKTGTELISSQSSRQLMTALWKDASNSYSSSIIAGRNNLIRLTRMTQQTLINEALIEETIAAAFENLGDLRKAASQLHGRLYTELFNSVKNKQFVQAGKFRYKPSYYAEMVARVKFHEAHSYAATQQAKNYDTDLIQVSSHNTTTALCQEFEGKIFSMGGKDKRFPILTTVPPYHPNCLHLLFPVFESALIVQGTLDSFSAFSKGEIDRPPVPAGFIPVSQRGAA